MTPDILVSELLRIAHKIDRSRRPSRSLVAEDLYAVLEQMHLPMDFGPPNPVQKTPRRRDDDEFTEPDWEDKPRWDDKIQRDHELGLLDQDSELGDYEDDRRETEPWLA